ncbi:hypothetical protein D8674_021896 [Pyrus ussuriensis x Pyrus communis]|uniref:Transposase-associated domain-containing protein n=1 Tax=Pyrus ussuriensis x Pyrus communis TaxID=2448454 RepID=A0A5N5GIW8_9ROSA|nr:hypothetical protein D8674_021896 [Pyrus ussuriensis x Pyrus communis]
MQMNYKKETEAKTHRRIKARFRCFFFLVLPIFCKFSSWYKLECFFLFFLCSGFSLGVCKTLTNNTRKDYKTGLAKFISNSLQVSSHDGNIKCPCAKCLNRFWLSNNEVEAHLIVWHGETFGDPLPSSQAAQQIDVVNTPHCELGPLLEDIFSGPSLQYLHIHISLKPWCKTPTHNYIWVVIHACENDCRLYWKHNSGLDVCHTCDVSRYKTEVDDTAPSAIYIVTNYLGSKYKHPYLLRWYKLRRNVYVEQKTRD